MRNIAVVALLSIFLGGTGCRAEADRTVEDDIASLQPPPQPMRVSLSGEVTEEAIKRDVPYVPTAQATVDEMLRMAKVRKNDLVYDLGSGDGRIVITAARDYGARGVGVDIDPQRIIEANENARAARVTDKVQFIQGDLFETDLRPATVVTLYLLQSVNLKLRPRLFEQLRPGTPVVSHDFNMGEWEPDAQKSLGNDDIFLWIIPAKVDGRWTWVAAGGVKHEAELSQSFQYVSGRVSAEGDSAVISNGKLNGEEITFRVTRGGVEETYRGRVSGRTIKGTIERSGRRSPWTAQYE